MKTRIRRSKIKRARMSGFRTRRKTHGGRRIIARRRRQGRAI